MSDAAYDWLQGTTDSEHLFAYFIDRFTGTSETDSAVERMSIALMQTIHFVEALRRDAGIGGDSLLNLVVTNGQEAVVSRFSSSDDAPSTLYATAGREYVCHDGVCEMTKSDQRAVLVASKPLSEDEGWQPVPNNHLVFIRANRTLEYQPIGF